MLIRIVVATNPFRIDLISQNQLFKASYRGLTSQEEEERENLHLDRQVVREIS